MKILNDISLNNSQQTIRKIPRMRTVHEAAQELKQLDPSTAVTEYHIRRLVLSGKLPKIKAGKKYLINLDLLLDYLENPRDGRLVLRMAQREAQGQHDKGAVPTKRLRRKHYRTPPLLRL